MLEFFQKGHKATKWILGVILVLIALSMVITLVPGIGAPSGGDLGSETVATVGDEKITISDMQFAISNVLRGRQMPPELVELYMPELVNRAIIERAMFLQAKEMGLRMTPQEQASVIRTLLPKDFFTDDGRLQNAEAYKGYVQQQLNMTVAKFESNVAKQSLIVKMQNMIADSVVVPPQELERDFHTKYDKIKLQYVEISGEELLKTTTLSQAEIEEHYKQFKPTYKVAPARNLEYVVLDAKQIAASMKNSDADLKSFYQSNLERYKTPLRVRTRHILFKTADLPKEQAEKKKAQAEDVLKQIKAGGDFAALAKKFSDDPGSAVKGGDLDFHGKGDFVKNFEDTMLRLKKGEMSGLVQTEFGYHIIQVTDREDQRVKPFEEVKGEIALERSRSLVNDRIQSMADQVHQAFVRSPGDGEKTATALGLTVQKVEGTRNGDPLPQLGSVPEFEGNIGSLKAGDVTPVLTIGSDKLVVARVAAIQPERTATLAEVLERVTQEAKNRKISRFLQDKQLELQTKAAQLKSLEAVAKAMNLTIKTAEPFSRTDSPKGLGQAFYFAKAFDEPLGTIAGPVNNGTSLLAGAAVEKIPADMGKFAEERPQLLRDAKSRKTRERADLFAEGVLQRFQDKGRIKRNEDAIKRLVQLYKVNS